VGTTNGDLTGGVDAMRGFCQFGGSAEDIFTFTPDAGQVGTDLTLLLDSATDLGLYARTDCTAPDKEIACIDAGFGGDTETLTLTIANTDPITIVVDGFAPGQEGPFTLTATFIANP
jgi:hypothetical protein